MNHPDAAPIAPAPELAAACHARQAARYRLLRDDARAAGQDSYARALDERYRKHRAEMRAATGMRKPA